MLNQPTIEKLHSMKLYGMADAFHAQLETADTSQLGFEERFALLVDRQWLWKENRALARRLRAAHLKERGVLVGAPAPQRIRACTHLDVSAAQAERAAETIRKTMARLVPVAR